MMMFLATEKCKRCPYWPVAKWSVRHIAFHSVIQPLLFITSMAIIEKYVTVKFTPNLAVSLGNACLGLQVNPDIWTGLIKDFIL